MIEQDTIRLLRKCDAGVKMGVESIELVNLEQKLAVDIRSFL